MFLYCLFALFCGCLCFQRMVFNCFLEGGRSSPFPRLPTWEATPKKPGGAKPLPAPVHLIKSALKASQHLRCDDSHSRQVSCEHIFSLYGPPGLGATRGFSRSPTSAYRSDLKIGTHKLEQN